MIPDLDIYRSANVLVKRHGQDAPIKAAMRADAMLEAGDLHGRAVHRYRPGLAGVGQKWQTFRPGRKAASCYTAYTARPGWQKRKRVRKYQAGEPGHDGNYTNRACQKYLQVLGRSECGVTKDGRTSPREAAFVQVGPWRLDRGLTFGRCEGTAETGTAATSALNWGPPRKHGARPVVPSRLGGRRPEMARLPGRDGGHTIVYVPCDWPRLRAGAFLVRNWLV